MCPIGNNNFGVDMKLADFSPWLIVLACIVPIGTEAATININPGNVSTFYSHVADPSAPATRFEFAPGMNLAPFDVIGRVGDAYVFNGAGITGSQNAGAVDWAENQGLVNILDSDIDFTGLSILNSHYRDDSGAHQLQFSTALNIKRSTVDFNTSVLIGNGKGPLWINSGSDVSIDDSTITGHYFVLGSSGSDVRITDSDLISIHPDEAGDKHSLIHSAAAMTDPFDGAAYVDSNTSVTNSTFEMFTGTSILSGNGNNIAGRAELALTDVAIDWHGNDGVRPVGYVDVHPNYFGLHLDLSGTYPTADVDISGPLPNTDFGWFINSRGNLGDPLAPSTICFDGLNCLEYGSGGTVVAVPEPSGSALLLIGVAILFAMMFRRRRPDANRSPLVTT